MTSAQLAERCYDYAARCWLFARQQDNADDKLALIEMAQTWLALADRVEGKESLLGLPEVPGSELYH
jgi:hypothetical protein